MPTSPKPGVRGGLCMRIAQGYGLLGSLGGEEGDSSPARCWVVAWKHGVLACPLDGL